MIEARFTIGRVLVLAWRAWIACRWQVLLVAIPIAVADGIYRPQLFAELRHSISRGWEYMIGIWIDTSVELLAVSSLAFAAVRYARGERVRPSDVLRLPWQRIPLALLVALLVQTIAHWPGAAFSWSSRTSLLIGSLVFAINFLVVNTVAFLYLPILLLERHSVAAAFDRGLELVSLHLWRVLALNILAWTTLLLATSIGWEVARMAHSAWGYPDPHPIRLVWMVATISVGSCIPAAAYHLLRTEQEGATPRALARVFD